MIRILILYMGIGLAFSLLGASFNCSKARSKMENLICSNKEISYLDSELGTLYIKVLKKLPEEQRYTFKREEKLWIKERNRCKNNTHCIIEHYKNRIKTLSSMKEVQIQNNTYHFARKQNIIQSVEKKEEESFSNTFTFSQKKSSLSSIEAKKMPSSKVIIATGYGINKEKALKSAFKSAVSQYVGILIDADTIVKNDILIKDEILTASNGYIQSYDEISIEKDDGLVEVKIRALVKSQKVFSKIKSLNIATAKISGGKGVYARITSKKIARDDAAKILKKAFEKFFNKETIRELLSIGIKDIKIDEKGLKNNKVPVTVSYVMKIKRKPYEQKVKQLEQTFEGLGAQLKKGVDFPNWNMSRNKNNLTVNNTRSIRKLLPTDFAFVKYLGRGYRLDVWRFPKDWKGIYPFKALDDSGPTERFNWKSYYNLKLSIYGYDGQTITSEYLDIREWKSMLKSWIPRGSYYLDGFYSERVKVISPIFSNTDGKNEVNLETKIWIDLNDIKDMSSAKLELVEI